MKICLTCEGVVPDDNAARRCVHCGGPLLDTVTVHYPERRGDDDARSPLVGRVVDGKYRVIGVLGRGGMGTVYRAVHEVSLVHVALKVLHPRFAARQEFRAWFLGEARKAGRVVHENSARVMDVGVAPDGMVYIAVEFVDGVTLHDWIGGGPVEPARLMPLLEQVARALASAHAAGVVHRDLSPRNVMVTVRDGRTVAKILDFGIAVGPAPSPGDAGLQDSAPAGFANPPYSAPEHLAGDEVDGRADLYSLGVIAYEALSGELPVQGSTGRELAAATLEGIVRPMRTRASVPRSLARLIARLLARDPDDRPVAADEVADRLHRILLPRRLALSVASIVALVGSTAAFAIAHAPGRSQPAYLEVRDGMLALRSGPDALEVQELRRADLLATQFDFGGFDPARLQAELSTPDRPPDLVELGALVRVDAGALRFGAAATAFVGDLVARGGGGPVDLRFVVPGRAPLGFARLRLDDTAPAVTVTVRGGDPRTLRGADILRLDVADGGQVQTVSLHVESDRGPVGEAVEVGAPSIEGRAIDLLGRSLPGVRSFGAVRLWASATDRAGNVGRSHQLEFAELDLDVPRIVGVVSASGGRVVVEESDGARIRVSLDREEPGLVVLVRAPGTEGFRDAAAVRPLGDRLDVRLPSESPDGRWVFVVRDPAGNVSPEFEEDLEFRGADPDVEVEPVDVASGAGGRTCVRLDDQLVCSGEPVDLSLRHNSIYAVERARLFTGAGEAAGVDVDVLDASGGRAILRVGALSAGAYELRLRLVEPIEGRVAEVSPTRVWVLPPTVVLRIPDARGARHLREFAERTVLRTGDGTLSQGPAWRLEPPDARLLRGRIWAGPLGSPSPRELDAVGSPSADLLADGPLGRGWHLVGIDAVDLLGRPIVVRCGDATAPSVRLPDGRLGLEIARFFYHDQPFAAVEPTVFVEHGQAVRVELRTSLPWEDVPAVRARLAGAELVVVRSTEDPSGNRLTFQLPFEQVAVAADLSLFGPRDFATGIDASMTLNVSSPVGEHAVVVAVRTIRSTLREVLLGELSSRELPPPIAAVRLCPVPGPAGAWREPEFGDVDARRHARIGPPIAVRDVPDVYVQDRETSRATYFAIVAAGLRELAARGDDSDRRALVHPADPLGVERLTEDGMFPSAHRAAPERLLRAVDRAPDRPISGVDAFQAHAALSLLGLLVADDPRLVRLPLGCELEIAAFGGVRGRTLSGATARGRAIDPVALRRLAGRSGDLIAWPPDAAELVACGDFSESELGDRLIGLDSGVREWVLDLPFLSGGSDGRVLLEEWLGDHRRHVEQTRELFFLRQGVNLPGELRAFAETYGVVRGAAAVAGQLPTGSRSGQGASWPGVVRVLQLRRDGAGLIPGEVDPRLLACGFRIAGGERFVTEVRRQW